MSTVALDQSQRVEEGSLYFGTIVNILSMYWRGTVLHKEASW